MIQVKNLTKRYGSHIAVDNISFSISQGEVVGFLGPNGAGKSTVMNMMTGFISSTNGTVLINGFDILDEPEKAKSFIGYLPDSPPVYNEMLVVEYLKFVCDLKKVKRSNWDKTVADVMEKVKITDMKNRLIKNLSKGYRQRVGLAQALIGNPKVIILDEPMVGLDPKQIIEMRDVIKKLGEHHTLILSSHILSEITAVCDRVLIINRGVIVASDTPKNLGKNLTGGREMLLRIKGTKEEIKKSLDMLTILDSYKIIGSLEDNTLDINIVGKQGIDIREAISVNLAKNNLPIYLMKPLDLSLEEIFLQITSGEKINLSPAIQSIENDSETITNNQGGKQ